ncbi:MAG TPA: hypothetical protein PK976_04145 [Bacteroidales bacterium]|nr:hypothetical protein [Bacteroidales bacterium]
MDIVKVFEDSSEIIDSETHVEQESNKVLSKIRDGLINIGFQVEAGKKADEKINVPVLFGKNGKIVRSFDADAYCEENGFVIEVEAGRGVTNYQFLKDLFQACMMHEVNYLAIAVRNKYRNNRDYEKVQTFFETLYASQRLQLPLKGILVIGY